MSERDVQDTQAISILPEEPVEPPGPIRPTKIRKFVPGFSVSANGFHFSNNSWPSHPFTEIHLGSIGGKSVRIPIGDDSNGLCGGMVFAVRDYFETSKKPADTTTPTPGSALYEYIKQRLVDSFNIPGGPLTYYKFMLPTTSNVDRYQAMRWEEGPKIMGDIYSGKLSPIGVVNIISANPFDVGRNHVILAYGYEQIGTSLTIYAYDPNSPYSENLSVTMSGGRVSSNSLSVDVYCFFRLSYQFRNPPAIIDSEKIRRWLRCLYLDLLNREPDQGGINYYIDLISRGTATKESIVDILLRSHEYCNIIVNSFYNLYLERQSDPGGLQFYSNLLRNGTPFQNIIISLCDSQEYKSKYPVPDEFVKSLYFKLLGRPPEPGAVENHSLRTGGQSTTDAIKQFLTSPEYGQKVTIEYFRKFLGRDQNLGTYYSERIQNGLPLQAFIKELITSEEYQQRSLSR